MTKRITESHKKRTREEQIELLKQAHILDEEGNLDKKFFPNQRKKKAKTT